MPIEARQTDYKLEDHNLDRINEEIYDQEQDKTCNTFVFNIDSFKFLDEFPRTIAGIKSMYPNEFFTEDTFERLSRSIHLADYKYSLNSPNIQFEFWGDTKDEAILYTVEIFNSEYQCKNMQVIGMTKNELEQLSNQKANKDNNITVYTKSDDGLIVRTKGGIVQNYLIVGM